MDVIDKFVIGDLDYIYFDFSCTHLDKRLKENGITLEYIKYLIYNEEPSECTHSRGNRYEVYYEAPETKDYGEIKLIFACEDYRIVVISVMPNNSIGRFKQQIRFYSRSDKKRIQLTARAHQKVKAY